MICFLCDCVGRKITYIYFSQAEIAPVFTIVNFVSDFGNEFCFVHYGNFIDFTVVPREGFWKVVTVAVCWN